MSARALAAATALALTIASLACAGPANRQASGHNALRPEERNQSHAEQSVCVSDDVLYQAGDAMPAPTPCARCVCTPPRSLCAPLACAQTPGCKALQRPNQCCPEYQCECERRGRVYANGERLSDADAAEEGGGEDPCRACYCRGGEVVCAAVECYRRDDCEPQLVPGRCCPKYDHCPPLAMDARPHHTRATFQPHAPDDQLPGASSIQAAALPWADEGSGAPTTTTTSTEGEELLTRLFVLSKEAELDPTTVSTEYTDLPEEMSTAPSPAPTDGGSPEVVKDEWSSDLSSSSSSTPSSSEEEQGEKGEEGGPPILLIGDDLANHQMDIVVAPEEEDETLSTHITTDVANVPFTEEGTTEEPLTTLFPTTDDMLGDQPHTQLSLLRVRLAQDKETSTEESQETTEEEERTTVAGESQSATPTTESEATTQPSESQPTTQQPQSETTTQPLESERSTQPSESEPTTQPLESEATTQQPESEATTQQPESEATTQQSESEPSTQQTESEASTQPSEFESSTQPEESEATTQQPQSEPSTESSEYPAHTDLLLKIAPEQSTEEQGTEEQGPPGAEEATEEALSSEEMSTPPPDTTSSDAAAPTTVAGDAKINPEVLGLKPTAAPAPANVTADPDAATTLSPHWLKDEAEAEAQRIERRVDEADKKDLFLLEDFFTKLYRHQIATDAASKER